MLNKTATLLVGGIVGLSATYAAAQAPSPVALRASARACHSFVQSQAAAAGYDVTPDEIKVEPGLGTSANDINVPFTVDSPNVTASGRCQATGTGNQFWIRSVELNFVKKN